MKNNINKSILGLKGEDFVCEMLINKGFSVFGRNIRRWGFEVDIVVYKYNPMSKSLEIRIVEVKTRTSFFNSHIYLLDHFSIKNKVRSLISSIQYINLSISNLFNETDLEIKDKHIHIDLVVVTGSENRKDSTYKICGYIKDVNLLI